MATEATQRTQWALFGCLLSAVCCLLFALSRHTNFSTSPRIRHTRAQYLSSNPLNPGSALELLKLLNLQLEVLHEFYWYL